jgi:PEP-CTERM motif-containing protein
MKKFLLACLFLVFTVSSANALIITDSSPTLLDSGWGAAYWLDGATDYVEYEHSVTYDPMFATINSATLTINFVDDSDRGFQAKSEWGLGTGDFTDWDFGEIDPGAFDFNIATSSVEDGILAVKIWSTWGDFGVSGSSLSVDYNPVPEPATMLLFGLGLLGVAGVSRKKS